MQTRLVALFAFACITGLLLGTAHSASGSTDTKRALCWGGQNVVFVAETWPRLTWTLRQDQRISVIRWENGKNHEAALDMRGVIPVPGTLFRDPFGAGVIADGGDRVIHVVKKGGSWVVDFLPDAQPIYLCGLFTTLTGKFKGVWIVHKDGISRYAKETSSGSWKRYSVQVPRTTIQQIAERSLYASGEGQLAGLLRNGQRWGIWHQDGDPAKMRFDFDASVGSQIEVPHTGDHCQ